MSDLISRQQAIEAIDEIPFNAVFDKRDPEYDPFLKYKVVEKPSVQYMTRIGARGHYYDVKKGDKR